MATSIQFSIRSLLVAMVLTAVGLAAGLPVIRSWGTASQLHFLVNAAILALLIGAFTAFRCVVRRRVERQAGEVLIRAATQGNRFVRLLHLFLLLLFLAGLLFMAASEALSVAGARPRFTNKVQWLNVAYLGWIAAWLVTNCWWGTGPGIAEMAANGLIENGTRFTHYDQFRSIRWNHYFPGTLMLSSRYYQLIQIVVPRWEREAIERFLEERGLITARREPAEEDNTPSHDEQMKEP